jgi:hypothetical protein
VEKVAQNWDPFEIFKKAPKENDRPIGENSSNPATLLITSLAAFCRHLFKL